MILHFNRGMINIHLYILIWRINSGEKIYLDCKLVSSASKSKKEKEKCINYFTLVNAFV